MVKYAVLYGFPEHDVKMALPRLQRLVTLNPNITFFPMFGPRQLIHIPMIVDRYMFGSNVKLWGRPFWGPIFHQLNWLASSAPGIFRLSKVINEKSMTFFKKTKIKEVCARIDKMKVQPLYIDFTPMALRNLDSSIVDWFSNSGKQFDFDYLIFYESDIFTTKPLNEIYREYTKLYDACFVNYDKATENWRFYNYPLGSRRATIRWLRQRMLPTTLFRSLYAGALISRSCFEKMKKLRIDLSGSPYCMCEMRLPTIINALGFKVGKLDFPFVRYRPVWSEHEIFAKQDSGIFHPVKKLVTIERRIASGKPVPC
jgi:hypothetical protein